MNKKQNKNIQRVVTTNGVMKIVQLVNIQLKKMLAYYVVVNGVVQVTKESEKMFADYGYNIA